MTSASLSHTLPAWTKTVLFFFVISSKSWFTTKENILFNVGTPVICFHLQMSAVCETNSECIMASARKHTTMRRFIPYRPPSGSCLMQWPFVVETIFTSETQNGFINSIRGWHFPHPHAGPENQCDEEYCSPHLSLSLTLLTAHTHLHKQIQISLFFSHAPLGYHTLNSDSVQPLRQVHTVKRVSIWTHSHMAVKLRERGLYSSVSYCSTVSWSTTLLRMS